MFLYADLSAFDSTMTQECVLVKQFQGPNCEKRLNNPPIRSMIAVSRKSAQTDPPEAQVVTQTYTIPADDEPEDPVKAYAGVLKTALNDPSSPSSVYGWSL